jgi:hypothetical protein
LLMQLASILNMLRSRDTLDKEEKYKTILEFHDSSAWDLGDVLYHAKSCVASRPALGGKSDYYLFPIGMAGRA